MINICSVISLAKKYQLGKIREQNLVDSGTFRNSAVWHEFDPGWRGGEMGLQLKPKDIVRSESHK